MGYLKFASVAVAITVAAIAPVLVGKAPNVAPPNAIQAGVGSARAAAATPAIKLAKLQSSSNENPGSYPHFATEAAVPSDTAPPLAPVAAEVGPQLPDAPALAALSSRDLAIGDAERRQANEGSGSPAAEVPAGNPAESSQREVLAVGAEDTRPRITAEDDNAAPSVAGSATAGGETAEGAASAKTAETQRAQAVAETISPVAANDPETAAAEVAEPSLPKKLAAADIGDGSSGEQARANIAVDAHLETAKTGQTSPEVEKIAASPVSAQEAPSAGQARSEARLDVNTEPPKTATPSAPAVAASADAKAGVGAGDTVRTEKVRQAKLDEGTASLQNNSSPALAPNQLSYLAYYPYAEILPKETPAQMALGELKGVSVGSPIDEIKRAARVFGLDFSFMKAVAKVESDFNPRQRTGSYIGLFQLSHYEFKKYGSGEITDPRDNAVAAAYKFITEATLFELDTHRNPTYSDLYLIHQQGWQGAAEHVAHPERIAWKSMCATDEGKEKGEKWCKRAVWQNTLPAIKHVWKSVENMTSGAFVAMWRQRIDRLYARYAANRSAK